MSIPRINVKIISEEVVKPCCPTPKNLRLLQASLFDHVNSPTLMPLIFFYSRPLTTYIDTNEVLDRLKGSLPNILSIFYPLAGRILDANYFNCNDEGIPYVLVKVDKPLEDVVHKIDVPELDKLLPLYGQEGFTNMLLAIQINVFMCSGLAIGVRMSHAISDAFSMTMFVKTWASMANHKGENTNLRPYFETCKIFPPLSSNVSANQNIDLINDRPVTKWFAFDEGKLDALRSKLLLKTSSYNVSEVRSSSATMILSAFIWSRVKVACHDCVNDIPHQAFHAVNLRSRLSPFSGKHYYFGNTFVNVIAKLSMARHDDDNKDEALMRDFLEHMKKSVARVLCKDGFIRQIKEGSEDLRFVMEHFEKESRGEIISLGFSNLRSLPIYEADFGWGKPIWVTSATLKYKNVVILIPYGLSSNHVIAYINLNCKDMAKLVSDTMFTSFVSRVPPFSSKL